MEDFFARLAINRGRIVNVHRDVSQRLPDYADMINPLHNHATNFYFDLGSFGVKLSIAVPSDMMYGYCETALIGTDGLLYPEHLGYYDIKRFDSIDELVDEINYLIGKFTNYKNEIVQLIRVFKARRTIAAFISAYYEHYKCKPSGKSYQIAKDDFYKLASV